MAKNSSKVLSGNEIGEAIKQWNPPHMGQTAGAGSGSELSGSLLTADQLEQLQKQAYEEGYERGSKAGFEYGHKEALNEGRGLLQEKMQQIDQLLRTLDTPLQQLDDQLEHEVIELVIAMVRQLVRREIRTDPAHIIGVVRESLSILPVTSRNIRVVLHPDDAALVREVYDLSEKELGWNIVEDPVLVRGGCRVVTDTSQVDATLESRLSALIAPLLSAQRDRDVQDMEDERGN